MRSPEVDAAIRTVPRRLFLPGATAVKAYADEPVRTMHEGNGGAISTASRPTVTAMMLGQLAAAPGHRALEIGAGSGHNTALLSTVVARSGRVTIAPATEAGWFVTTTRR